MSKYIYSRMIEVMQNRLAATGIPQDKAISACVAAVNMLHADLGGTRVYLAKRNPLRDRDSAIRSAFDGRNIDVVCERFGVSRATLYRKMGEK